MTIRTRKAQQANRGTTDGLTRIILPSTVRVVDEAKREIEVCSTSEAIDGHGTIFDYQASKDAFDRWAGNVREMHDRKAVGRRIEVRADDEGKRIFTRLFISKGAEDTWQKVLDGTLTGASIGAANVEWSSQRRANHDVPVATRYDLVELSLVDAPSNPDAAGITIFRDGVPSEALSEDPAAAPASSTAADEPGEDVAVQIAARALASAIRERARGSSGAAAAVRDRPSGARTWRIAERGASKAADRALPQSLLDSLNASAPDHPYDVAADAAIGTPQRPEQRPSSDLTDGAMQHDPRDLMAGHVDEMGRDGQQFPMDVLLAAALGELMEDLHRTGTCPLCQGQVVALDVDGNVLADGGEDDPVTFNAPQELKYPSDGPRVAEADVTRAVVSAVEQRLAGLRGEITQLFGRFEQRLDAVERRRAPGGPQIFAADRRAPVAGGGETSYEERIAALTGLSGQLVDPQSQIAVATEIMRLQQEAGGMPPAMQVMPRAGSGYQQSGGYRRR